MEPHVPSGGFTFGGGSSAIISKSGGPAWGGDAGSNQPLGLTPSGGVAFSGKGATLNR